MNYDFSERDAVLAVCPILFCRRSGLCRNAGAEVPCLKTHQSADEARDELSALLRRLYLAHGGDPAKLDRPLRYTQEIDGKMGALKRALQLADP